MGQVRGDLRHRQGRNETNQRQQYYTGGGDLGGGGQEGTVPLES